MAQLNELITTGVIRAIGGIKSDSGITVYGEISLGDSNNYSDSYAIVPGYTNYSRIGTTDKKFYEGYINSVYSNYVYAYNTLYVGKASTNVGVLRFYNGGAYTCDIKPSTSMTANRTLTLPNETSTIATRSWVQSTEDMTTKTVTSSAGTNVSRAVFYSQQRSGFIDIYISALTNSIAVSSQYGNLRYASCSINIPTGLGWSNSNGFVVSAVQKCNTGLNFVSINNVTDSAISFFLTTSQNESAKQYNIYMHLICLDF